MSDLTKRFEFSEGPSLEGSAYKVYSGLISQSSTSAPTVKILQNTIGNIVWTRLSTGRYLGTLSNAFTTNKTLFLLGHADSSSFFAASWININSIELDTADNSATLGDNFLVDSSIEIRVYS